jgi:hypothetical protein
MGSCQARLTWAMMNQLNRKPIHVSMTGAIEILIKGIDKIKYIR